MDIITHLHKLQTQDLFLILHDHISVIPWGSDSAIWLSHQHC